MRFTKKRNPAALQFAGIQFKSKLELVIAYDLAALKKNRDIADWRYEPKFDLPAKTPTGRTKTHRIDFKITALDGRVLYLEAKGYRFRDGETRRQWVEHYHSITVHVASSRAEATTIVMQFIGK